MSAPDLVIGGVAVPLGTIVDVELDVGRLPNHTRLNLPVRIVRGSKPGPTVWISAAIHGDELNGVEIVRRVLDSVDPKRLRGTLLVVPIVNVHGFLTQSRYLPDGRDLNRSFPGSTKGSLAARLAKLFMDEIVEKCSYGIDLHTGSGDRTNLPQVRADMDDPDVQRLAIAFGAPAILHSRVRDGSLREAATSLGIKTLLFEGGEARRFEEDVIVMGVKGVRRVLAELEMIRLKVPDTKRCWYARKSTWLRSGRSGLLRMAVRLGDEVRKGQVVARIANPLGDDEFVVKSTVAGLIIGAARNPVLYQGDAVVHVAHGAEEPCGFDPKAITKKKAGTKKVGAKTSEAQGDGAPKPAAKKKKKAAK